MSFIESLIDDLCPWSAARQLAARPSLPRRLLRASRVANTVLGPLGSRLDALDARLDPDRIDPRRWDNPEVHEPLASLGDRCPDEATAVRLLDRLDVLSGRVSVEADAVADGLYRLAHLGQGVVLRHGGRVQRLDAVQAGPRGEQVMMPLSGLFSDVPFPAIYDQTGLSGDVGLAMERYRRAQRLLAQADPAASSDLHRTVGVVALLPPVPGPVVPTPPQAHWSFNLRLRLPGMIFVNPFTVGAPGLAEGLLHEYLHQRMWLWWELCPPKGLPPWSEWMRSPISGGERPMITMLQALVIFRCVAAMHQALLRGSALSSEERAWSSARLARLTTSLPMLVAELQDRLKAGSGAQRLVQRVWADLDALTRPLACCPPRPLVGPPCDRGARSPSAPRRPAPPPLAGRAVR